MLLLPEGRRPPGPQASSASAHPNAHRARWHANAHRARWHAMIPRWPAGKINRQSARAFWNDTSGVILPYLTIMLIVIVGLSVLALDGRAAHEPANPTAKWRRCAGARRCG